MLGFFDDMLLTDDHEMGLVSEQRQHDEIGIRPIEAVAGVGIVIWGNLKVSNVVHHLVFSLSGNAGVRQNYSLALKKN